MTTVLFTDIVGSTARAVALGDRRWAELLEQHHELVREQLARFGGREMDTTGDGFFAVFSEPVAGVRCGVAIVEELRSLDLDVRAGLHAGDCLVVGTKCTGVGDSHRCTPRRVGAAGRGARVRARHGDIRRHRGALRGSRCGRDPRRSRSVARVRRGPGGRAIAERREASGRALMALDRAQGARLRQFVARCTVVEPQSSSRHDRARLPAPQERALQGEGGLA